MYWEQFTNSLLLTWFKLVSLANHLPGMKGGKGSASETSY